VERSSMLTPSMTDRAGTLRRARALPRTGSVAERRINPAFPPSGVTGLRKPILLVDGSPGERVLFEQTFHSDLAVACSVRELETLIRRGGDWQTAFVSFHLAAGAPTGLTAMLRLAQARPNLPMVAYTRGCENGSTLFGAAARHWLGVRSVVDRDHNDPRDLRRSARIAAEAGDCSPVRWTQRLQYAYLIDEVLANPSWISIWRAICESSADMQLTGALLGVSAAQLRGFKDRATDAVSTFREKLNGIPHPGCTRNKKGILSAFAAENRLFLTAAGLSEVMCPESATSAAVAAEPAI
jgi:hypothetical protein